MHCRCCRRRCRWGGRWWYHWPRLWRCRHRWLIQRGGRAGLPHLTRLASSRRLARTANTGFVLSHGNAGEDGHHNEPAIGQLVVARHSIAGVAVLARSAEIAKHIAGFDGPIEHGAGGWVSSPLLAEDRHARVHHLHDMIEAHRERIVRRIANGRRALGAAEADAKSIKARDERRSRTGTRCALLHVVGAGGHTHHPWRAGPTAFQLLVLEPLGCKTQWRHAIAQVARRGLFGAPLRRQRLQRLREVTRDGVVHRNWGGCARGHAGLLIAAFTQRTRGSQRRRHCKSRRHGGDGTERGDSVSHPGHPGRSESDHWASGSCSGKATHTFFMR